MTYAEATLTVADVAERLGVTVDSVRRWLRSGELHGYRLARKSGWKIRPADLEAFIAQRSAREAGAKMPADA